MSSVRRMKIRKRLTLVMLIGTIGFTLLVYSNIQALRKYAIHTYYNPRGLSTVSDQIILPMVHVITPTYSRLTQKADLTRLIQTLRLVPRLHWMLVEDSTTKTSLVSHLLERSYLNFTHLNIRTPVKYRKGLHGPRGIAQRNIALAWLRNQTSVDGVVYFADDDNTYDVQLFEEIRYTRGVSVLPVGLIAPWFEAPKVENNKVIGWISTYNARTFNIDMAGFAVNVSLLRRDPNIEFKIDSRPGYIEDGFLKQFKIELSDLEPKADNCTKVFVWHTKTEMSRGVKHGNLAKKYGAIYANAEV